MTRGNMAGIHTVGMGSHSRRFLTAPAITAQIERGTALSHIDVWPSGKLIKRDEFVRTSRPAILIAARVCNPVE